MAGKIKIDFRMKIRLGIKNRARKSNSLGMKLEFYNK
jgi:hypothetical protein